MRWVWRFNDLVGLGALASIFFLGVFSFSVQAFLGGAFAGPGWTAFGRRWAQVYFEQFGKFVDAVLPVALLGAEAGRVDDERAVARQAVH